MGSGSRLVWLVIGAVLVLLSACGEDEERLIVEPVVSPTDHAVTPPASTPASQASATFTLGFSAAVTISPTPSRGTPTRTATPSPTPTATPIDLDAFVGVYDLSFDPQFQRSDAIAEVSKEEAEITIVIWSDGHGFVALHGTPSADGHVILDGEGGIPNDAIFPSHGTAEFADSGSTQRVRGTFTNAFGPGGPFTLERPATRGESRYNGMYRFAFDPSPGGCKCATTSTFTIVTDDDGVGMSAFAADELDAGDTRQSTFDFGECLVTTRGRLRCVLGYETTFVPLPGEPPAGPRFSVTLMGFLPAVGSGATGEGRADAPIFPQVFFLGGDWTATRVAP